MTRVAHCLAVGVSSLLLAACASAGPSTAPDPSQPSSPRFSAYPGPSPTVGSYPMFGPTNYTYHLRVGCFCPDANAPIEVSVAHGVVVGAVYVDGGRGRAAMTGTNRPVPHYRWLTINDVIAAANNTTAHLVTVRWPAGQDYPSSVSIDPSERIADDEGTYSISKVRVG